MKIKALVQTAVFTALLCAVAPLSLPVGPVPVSLATLVIYIAAGVLGRGRAALAVFVYILLGAAGLPVFTGFSGGVQKLVGVTGGYILGYIPLAFMSGIFPAVGARRGGGRVIGIMYPVGMIAGTAALYALGTAWFVVSTGSALSYALAVCVAPFLPGDAVKIAVAAVTAPAIRRGLGKLSA
ncbi:MAG: biotin transporter BioY [Oscillospiraceae bacterium]|nr:biotin transporter BioY [Oscillospiraceae bacterium]